MHQVSKDINKRKNCKMLNYIEIFKVLHITILKGLIKTKALITCEK